MCSGEPVPGHWVRINRPEARKRAGERDLATGLDDLRALAMRSGSCRSGTASSPWSGTASAATIAFLALTRLGADAAAVSPDEIQNYLDEAPRVTKPFSFHFGSCDALVPPAEFERIRAALAGKDGDVVLHEGADHGFAREETSNYDPAIAQRSEERAFARLDRLKTPLAAV